MDGLLDRVLLSEAAVQTWVDAARRLAPTLSPEVAAGSIPNEDAEVLPDGTLRIFIALPDGRVLLESIVPTDQWRWAENGRD